MQANELWTRVALEMLGRGMSVAEAAVKGDDAVEKYRERFGVSLSLKTQAGDVHLDLTGVTPEARECVSRALEIGIAAESAGHAVGDFEASEDDEENPESADGDELETGVDYENPIPF